MRFIALFILFVSAVLARNPRVVLQEFILEDPPFESCHASTLIETPKGLIVSYFAGSEEGNSDVAIYLSKEKERKWQEPEKVVYAEGVPCWNPVLSVLPSGEILLFYRAGPRPQNWSSFLMRSYDQGKTWTNPDILPAGVLGPIKNKPLLLEDGTLLCGSSVESYLAWGCWIDITRDQGKTWEKSIPINIPNQPFGIIQPTLFRSTSESLRLLARSHQVGYICTATSEDQGSSWSAAKLTELPNPNSGIDAVQVKDGRVFLVYNHTHKGRSPINLAVSEDGGETWNMTLTLESGPGSFSYPAIIQTSDGLVHITYTWNRTNIRHVVIQP